jgi:general stress protein YciG
MANNSNNRGGDTSKRGFASMDEKKQREIASKGGKASHGGGRGGNR